MFVLLHRIYSSEDPIVQLSGPFETHIEAVRHSQEQAKKVFEDLGLDHRDGIWLVLAESQGIGIKSLDEWEQHWEVRELHN